MKPKTSEKGIALLLAVLIASVILAIGFGISGILLQQTKMMGEIGYSVVSFYAADSGIEEILMSRQSPSLLGISKTPLPNEATYRVSVTPKGSVTPGGEECTADNFCIRSIGSYKRIRRAIEIQY